MARKSSPPSELAPDSSSAAPSSVIYLGRIPHGFYEEQMKAYFTQFGRIVNLRLSRNKKSGASKHYAFIQFESPEVASIVAETMDQYMMFSSLLQCHVLPLSKVHPEMWKGANRKFVKVPSSKLSRAAHNGPRTEEASALRKARLLRADEKKRKAIASLGMEYVFPGYKASATGDGV